MKTRVLLIFYRKIVFCVFTNVLNKCALFMQCKNVFRQSIVQNIHQQNCESPKPKLRLFLLMTMLTCSLISEKPFLWWTSRCTFTSYSWYAIQPFRNLILTSLSAPIILIGDKYGRGQYTYCLFDGQIMSFSC